MSVQSFDEMLAEAKRGSGSGDIDTSHLDRFTTTGRIVHEGAETLGDPEAEGLEPDAGEPQAELETDAEAEYDAEADMATEREDTGPEHDVAETAEVGEIDEPDIDDERASAQDSADIGGSQGQRGGSGAAGGGDPAEAIATAVPVPDSEPNQNSPTEQILVEEPTESKSASRRREKDISTARKSDQQDAVQAATTARRTSGSGGGSGDPLPRTGFALPEVKTSPVVRGIPSEIVTALRTRLKAAAIREKGVSDTVADAFSEQLSQSALVIAFLLAQLDVRMDADAATSVAVELFRSQDPLLGSVVERMDELEAREVEQADQVKTLVKLLSEVKTTGDVIEHALAYSIADRTENLARGSHTVDSIQLGHKSAVVVRDRAREETKKRIKLEKERDGRPIR